MISRYARPRWWQIYLTLPLLVGLFAVDSRLKISTRGHQIVQIGIVLLVYGLIHLWLKANASVLSNMDQRQYSNTIRVIRVPVSQLPDADDRPMFELPASEIKGILSDTFDIEYIDAKALPIDEVSEELKKE